MFWARERWRSEVLRDAGAQVLLSGFGGDHVLEGNIYFFADWVRAGAFGRAFGELARWAALGQSSFWKLAYTHALVPLMPTAVQSRLKVGSKPRIPAWVTRDSRDGMEEHANRVRRARPVGGALPWYGRHSAFLVQCFSRGIPRTDPFITYERRYPFLYRPLVEFTLQLPPEMKIRPGERKVALREAMRGVLPERVRTRLGEGGIGSRMLWSLNHERRRIESMLRDPMLAQMGFVDAESLRKAYHTARTGTSQLTVPLFSTLALESWLLIESGRWTLRDGNTTPLIYKEKSHGEHEAAVPGAGAR
jgi:asparagine synthase (glutamine-hydrolysing)